MNLDLLFIFVVLINASIGVGVFFHGPRSKVNRFFSAFAVFLDLWMISNFLENEPGIIGEKNQELFLRLDFTLAILAVYMLFRFCSSFVEYKIELPEFLRYRTSLLLSVIFLGACSLFTPLILFSVSSRGGVIHFDNGILWPLYALVLVSFAVGGLFLLLRERLQPAFDEKNRMRHRQITFISLGFFLSLSTAIFINFLQGFYPIDLEISRLGLYGMTFLVILSAYAIVKHHLLDIWIIVRLGAIYAILFATVTFIYTYLAGLAGNYISGSLTYIIPSILITFGFLPLKSLIETVTDRIFFRKTYSVQVIINQLNSIIHTSGLNLDNLLDNFNNVIIDYIRVEHAAIFLLSPAGEFVSRRALAGDARKPVLDRSHVIVEHIAKYPERLINKDQMGDALHQNLVDELDRLRASLIIPIEVNERVIGLYVIGAKKSQDPFTSEEIDLLRLIAAESGSSIDNARLFEELKNIDEVKSKFISIISHQLRTPLTSIRWNLELLLQEGFDRKTKDELFQNSYRGALNMAKNLDELFTALDIEEKGILPKMNVEQANFHELLKEALKEIDHEAKEKKLNLDISFPDELPTLALDKERISRVLVILLKNAVSYSNPGHEVSVVGMINIKDGIKYFVCSIRDQGIGLTSEDEQGIFTRFYRGEEAKKHSPNGSGLGLFVAKYLVNLHRGEIWYTSHGPHQGTTFSFSLPMT